MITWRSLQRTISLSAAALIFCCAVAASATAVPTAAAIEPLIAAVHLNGQRLSQSTIFLKDTAGRLYASEVTLRQLRLVLPETEIVRFEGEIYRCIDGVPSLTAAIAEADQAVIIQAAPSLFERQRLDLGEGASVPMTQSANGAFVNYDFFVERTDRQLSLNGIVDLNVFNGRGAGVSNFVVKAGADQRRLLRLDTSWTVDRPDGLTSIRFGDGITRGPTGGAPLRFGGIQFSRNFDVQPGYVTIPLPTLTGNAALPSVADVYVNSVLQQSHDLQVGPFEIRRAPVQTGGGAIQLVTNDILGRQTITTHKYYTSSEMLRKGLHDFSYEAGFLRDEFGTKSNKYGDFIASTVHRYGVSDELTGEASVQLTKSNQAIGAALTATVFDLALISASARVTRSNEGQGSAASFIVERRSRGLSIGARAEWRSHNYRMIGESETRRSRYTISAFADYSFDKGSVGFNYFRRDVRSGTDEELIGGFANLGFRGGTLHISARRAITGRSNTIFGASFALPFGPRRSAAVSVDVQGGRPLTRFSVQQNPPAAIGARYRAVLETGKQNAFQAEYVWQGPQANWGVQVAKAEKSNGLRFSVSGALGLISGRPFASNRLNSSFAEVRIDGHPGVRVYADNHLVGVTGKAGTLIVPNLRPYEANPIRIEQSDIPIGTRFDSFKAVVRPYARSGTTIQFSPNLVRGVLMRVNLVGGELLPAGAAVTVLGRSGTHPVATGGELYIEGLKGTERLRAQWKGRSCFFEVVVPNNNDPQPLIEGLICRDERHASN